MQHADDHEPITTEVWRSCSVCYAARSATFAAFAEEAPGLGPHDWDAMIERMKEIAGTHLERLRLVDGRTSWSG
jgi:hypothetical protein